MRTEGGRMVANVTVGIGLGRWLQMFFYILYWLSFLANVYLFPLTPAKFIGNVLPNRIDAANMAAFNLVKILTFFPFAAL
jgi:hypothetical protein